MARFGYYDSSFLMPLVNDEEREIPLLTLFIEGMDRYFDMQTEIFEKLKNDEELKKIIGGFNIANADKVESMMEYMKSSTLEVYKKKLKYSEEKWRLITGLQDVSWIYLAPPKKLDEAEEKFITHCNPMLGQAKKNMEIMAEIMEKMVLSAMIQKEEETRKTETEQTETRKTSIAEIEETGKETLTI